MGRGKGEIREQPSGRRSEGEGAAERINSGQKFRDTHFTLSLEYQQASSLKRFLHLILGMSRLGSALQRSPPRLVSGLDMNARVMTTE